MYEIASDLPTATLRVRDGSRLLVLTAGVLRRLCRSSTQPARSSAVRPQPDVPAR